MSIKPESLSFQSYYLVGIKGVGMASLAAVLIDMGKKIQGWDVADSFITQPMLDRLKIQISDQKVLPNNIEAVIFTAAHHDVQHPLVQQASTRGIPIFSLAEVTGDLSQIKQTIAVCGVGGKSTTSAMLAWIFDQTTDQASYLVGVGEIKGLLKTGAWSKEHRHPKASSHALTDWFVVEADEYATNPTAIQAGYPAQPRFLSLRPDIIICTQILYDHPDVYPSISDTLNTFKQFFLHLPKRGLLILNADDPNSQILVSQLHHKRSDLKIVQVGLSSLADVQITEIQSKLGQTSAKLRLSNQFKEEWQINQDELHIRLSIPGQMNIRNATFALVAATQTGLPNDEVLSSLQSFHSTSRRLEKIAERDQVVYYDDYAHHPQEITATIEAIQSWYPDLPLTIIFQPHTYSRTKSLLADFATSLAQADQVILLPIFASARESDTATISSLDLLAEIKKLGGNVTFTNSLQNAADQVIQIKRGLVITMGAGDVYKIHGLIFGQTNPSRQT